MTESLYHVDSGIPHGGGDEPSPLLDRVLHDLDTGQRARVLDMVRKLDLDQDDPLWLIAIAIGQLQVLVEDAPNDWGNTFATFLENIDQWKNHNLKTLEQLALEAEAVNQLTHNCNALQKSVSDLQRVLKHLIENLKHSIDETQTSKNSIDSLRSSLGSGLQAIREESAAGNRNIGDRMSALEARQTENANGTWSGSKALAFLLFIGLLLNGLGLWQVYTAQQQTNERLEALMNP